MPRGPSLRSLGILAAITALALSGASAAGAHGGTVYKKRNLVSDIDGVARITDPNLVNPWGLSAGPATPLWVADNGTDKSTVYSGAIRRSIPMIVPLVVSLPNSAPTTSPGAMATVPMKIPATALARSAIARIARTVASRTT